MPDTTQFIAAARAMSGKSPEPQKGIFTNVPADALSEIPIYTRRRGRNLPMSKYGAAMAVLVNEAAARCVQVRMDAIGATKWRIRDQSQDRRIVATSDDYNPLNPIARAIKRYERRNKEILFARWEQALAITGESFVELALDSIAGQFPADIEWLNPLAVTIDAPSNDIRGFWYVSGTRSEYIDRDHMVYDRTPMDLTTDVYGYGSLMSTLGKINAVYGGDRIINAFWQNNALPGAFGTPGGDAAKAQGWSEDQIKRIRKAIGDNHKGVDNAWRLALYPFPIDFTVLDYPDLQKWAELLKTMESGIYAGMGVPRSIAGDSDSTRYQASPDDAQRFNRLIIHELSGIELSFNSSVALFFDDSGRYVLEFDRSAFDLVSETEEKRATLVRDDYRAGLISHNEARQARGEAPINLFTGKELRPGEEVEDFYFVDGVGLVPQSEIVNIWKYRITVAPSVYNSELLTGEPLPQPADPNQVIPTEEGAEQLDPTADPNALTGNTPAITPAVDPTKDGGKPLFVALDLSNDVDLRMLQKRLKEMYPNPSVEWNAPEDYHITLINADGVDEATMQAFTEAVQGLDLPELSLKVGSLHTFDDQGRHALHYRIRRNSDLLDFQAQLYELCQELGIQPSSYHVPGSFIPHITMAYLPERVSATTFRSKLTVRPQRFIVKSEDDELYRSDGVAETEPEVPNEELDNDHADLDAIDELKMWDEKARNKGAIKALTFTCQYIDTSTAQLIRSELANTEQSGVKTLFEKWRRVLEARAEVLPLESDGSELPEATRAYAECLKSFEIDDKGALWLHAYSIIGAKAISATQAKFESALVTQFTNAFNEKIRKTVFISRMLVMLTRYSRMATVDGYSDGGSEIDLEDDEDEESVAANKWLDAFIGDQEQYVRNIADVLYADDEITLDEIQAQKPYLWWTGSVLPAYNWALMTASKNARLKWIMDTAKENCHSCKALDGIVLTATRWKREGVEPGSRELACWGGNCGCKFEPTNQKKYRGTLPNWRKSIEMHDHQHYHRDYGVTV